MSRRWNGKSLVDELATRLWDTSSANKERIIGWINEIQDDLTKQIPLDFFKFKLKKMLPTQQEIIDLSPQVPSAPTTALAVGGSLTEDTSYKVYVSFLIYDQDLRDYVESEASSAGTERTATASDKTINLTAIDTMDGDTSIQPNTIYRRIYVAKKASTDTAYGEPFYLADISDNTTTTYSVTSEPTSTRTPVSDSEVDQITSDHPYFSSQNRRLNRDDMNRIRRFDPNGSETTSPNSFDYVGTRKIFIYPQLSTGSTTAQKTLSYFVYRRPHEVFYDVDCKIDLPILFKKALFEGVIWKGYEFKDRAGKESVAANYEEYKREAILALTRQKGRPSAVRDVNGDTFGYEV